MLDVLRHARVAADALAGFQQHRFLASGLARLDAAAPHLPGLAELTKAQVLGWIEQVHQQPRRGEMLRHGAARRILAGQEVFAGVVIEAAGPAELGRQRRVGMLLLDLHREDQRPRIGHGLVAVGDGAVQLTLQLRLANQVAQGDQLIAARIEKQRLFVFGQVAVQGRIRFEKRDAKVQGQDPAQLPGHRRQIE